MKSALIPDRHYNMHERRIIMEKVNGRTVEKLRRLKHNKEIIYIS